MRPGGTVAGLMMAVAVLLAGGAARAQPSPPQRSGAELRRELGRAVAAGDSAAVTRAAQVLAAMGGSLSDDGIARITPLLTAPGIAERLRANGIAGSAGTAPIRFAEVPAEYRLVEGIAWDAPTGRLFAGTVVDGRLAMRTRDGDWHEVPLGAPRGGLFGMHIDAPRRLLWIATGSVEQTAVAGERIAGLIAVDLDTLAVVRRVPAEDSSVLGDLTVGSDGTVYASDPVSGAVYRCRPGCTRTDLLVAAGSFRSPQGLAFLGGRLVLADYSSGLWEIDPAGGRAAPVAIGGPQMLEGIDGLVAGPGTAELVAIQNGSRPRRIALIRRDANGGYVATARFTIAADAGEPTLATIGDGGALLFVGDGQWERYGPGGTRVDAGPARPTPILMLPGIGANP